MKEELWMERCFLLDFQPIIFDLSSSCFPIGEIAWYLNFSCSFILLTRIFNAKFLIFGEKWSQIQCLVESKWKNALFQCTRPHFLASKWLTVLQQNNVEALSGSLWLPLVHSDSLWLALRLSLVPSGSLWFPLALSGSLWLSIALQICLQNPCSARKALARLVT